MVEEDPHEVDCLKEALAVSQFGAVNLQQVEDGEQALAFLRQEYPYYDVSRPDLIFLDLNLPGMSGREWPKALGLRRWPPGQKRRGVEHISPKNKKGG